MTPPLAQIPQGLLLFAVFGQLGILSALLLLLLLQTIARDRKTMRKTQMKHGYIEMIGRLLTDQPEAVAMPATELEIEALAEVAIDVINSIAGETAERIRLLLVETGVVDHYIGKSTDHSWMKRIYAIERLGLFALDHLRELFKQRLAVETVYPVRIRLVWSLSKVADAETVPLITRLLATEISISSKFNEYIYGNMIVSCRDKGLATSITGYLGALETDAGVPTGVKKDFIEACGSAELVEAAGTIIDYYRHDHSPEMGISCIRAAGRLVAAVGSGQLPGPQREMLSQQVIFPGLADADWRIRAVAANAAAASSVPASSLLIPLLNDPSYHVRLNAGKALASCGQAGKAALSRQLDSEDRFARETARYVLQPEGRE